MNPSYVLWGFGGLAKTILPLLPKGGVIGYFADEASSWSAIPWLGTYNEAIHSEAQLIIALGINGRREAAFARAKHEIHTTIAPTATIADNVTLEQGVMVMPQVIIQDDAVLSKGVVANTRSIIDHDAIIGEFSHIAVGAIVGSRSLIGRHVYIDVGAVVPPGSTVPDHTVIKPGTVYQPQYVS